MSVLSSVVCTLTLLNMLCFASAHKAIALKTFEEDIMSTNPVDGTKFVFSRTDVRFTNTDGITVFKTSDTDLAEYLGMYEQQDICVIEMKNNVTDFDTWIWNGRLTENEPINMDTVFAEANLKEFKQTGGFNQQLQLLEKQNIFENEINIIVFFKNASNAIDMATLVRNIDTDIPKSCWNVLQSDPPPTITKIPSIGITSPTVFGTKHVSMLTLPAREHSLNAFVKANIKELEINNK